MAAMSNVAICIHNDLLVRTAGCAGQRERKQTRPYVRVASVGIHFMSKYCQSAHFMLSTVFCVLGLQHRTKQRLELLCNRGERKQAHTYVISQERFIFQRTVQQDVVRGCWGARVAGLCCLIRPHGD